MIQLGAITNIVLLAINLWAFYVLGGHWWSLVAVLFCAAGLGYWIGTWIWMPVPEGDNDSTESRQPE